MSVAIPEWIFSASSVSSLRIKAAEHPTLILLWVSLINLGGAKARPIPQISLKIVLMVPIWTLSNPHQYLTSPKKSRREGGFLDSKICLLFAPISNFPCKDHKIRIYNAFILLNVRYYSIVCHFCSRQSVYERERNPQQGITSCFKWLSDIISRFTECSRSPNSLCGSSMKTIATKMLKCMNSFNPTSLRSRKSPMCWLPIVHNLAIESYVPFRISSSTIKTLCFLHLFKALHL